MSPLATKVLSNFARIQYRELALKQAKTPIASSWVSNKMSEKQNAVIVGSGKGKYQGAGTVADEQGIFGMSTALWMLEDGGYNVTVLDKCGTLPAPDAASTGESCSLLLHMTLIKCRSERLNPGRKKNLN